MAFLVNLCGTFIAQVGLLMMKQAHKSLEQTKITHDTDDKFVSQNRSRSSMMAYKTPKWVTGFCLQLSGNIIQIGTYPFGDLVLLSTTNMFAIIISITLSVVFLNEKFIWQYDMAAFVLMGFGSFTIIVLSNKEDKTYTTELAKRLLTSWKSIVSVIVFFTLLILTFVFLQRFLEKVEQFGFDAENWAMRQQRRQVNPQPQ